LNYILTKLLNRGRREGRGRDGEKNIGKTSQKPKDASKELRWIL
jgi:hypothetical protein